MKLFTRLRKVCVRHVKVYARIENPYADVNSEIRVYYEYIYMYK